jgi:hypothetical protein
VFIAYADNPTLPVSKQAPIPTLQFPLVPQQTEGQRENNGCSKIKGKGAKYWYEAGEVAYHVLWNGIPIRKFFYLFSLMLLCIEKTA